MTEYTSSIPEAYLEPTPIYSMCLHRSGVHMEDRWALTYRDLDNYGYAGPEKGWEV